MAIWRLRVTRLSLDRVSKRFGGVEAVAGVSFDVPGGQITGLIGPNGAGKTTLVNLITGMLKVSSGRIGIDGRDITEAPPHRVARAGIARTFQNIRLLREASVLDNVVIGYHRHERTSFAQNLLGLPAARRERATLREAARLLLERFEMSRYADYPATALSYGHQRRVEMMRALAARPALLLLDEPVAGMNDVEAEELGSIIRALARDGLGILLIEHNLRFIMSLCTEVHVVTSGRLIASGSPEHVCSDPAVIAAYIGG
jgi:branched-chain amino acid transport system ATP-binding protein